MTKSNSRLHAFSPSAASRAALVAAAFLCVSTFAGAQSEQDFVNTVYLMQQQDSAEAAHSAAELVAAMSGDTGNAALLGQWTDHYLANPQSPLRCDRVYAHMLRAMTANSFFMPFAEKQLRLVTRNEVGQRATDIPVTDSNGQSMLLSQVESPLTLLVFTDPDCGECRKKVPRLLSTEALKRADLAIVTAQATPESDIIVRGLYYLPALPAVYLLDNGKRVLLKDSTIEAVLDCLKAVPCP